MRRVASARFKKTLELARNVVNITFPPEFGTPVLLNTLDGMAAMFPAYLSMRTLIDDQAVTLYPVGEGIDEHSAMIDLFSLFASPETYQDIQITEPVSKSSAIFVAQQSPYATIIFQKIRPSRAIRNLSA